MPGPITFYPAFGSPYSYVAAQLIDEIAFKHDRQVLWRPVRLSTVLEHLHPEGRPPIAPGKLAYWRHDVERVCRLRGLPFSRPEEADPPFDCDALYHTVYAFADGDEAQMRAMSLAVLSVIWAQGRALTDVDSVAAGLRRFNLSRVVVRGYATSGTGASLHDAAVRDAVASGMIGAPWLTVDGEAFWGHDRLPYLDMWLAKAGRLQPVSG